MRDGLDHGSILVSLAQVVVGRRFLARSVYVWAVFTMSRDQQDKSPWDLLVLQGCQRSWKLCQSVPSSAVYACVGQELASILFRDTPQYLSCILRNARIRCTGQRTKG